MSNRAIGLLVVAVVLAVAAVLLWPSSELSDQPQEQSTTRLGSSNATDTPTTTAPQASERRDWFPDLSDPQPSMTTGDAAAGTSGRFNCSIQDLYREVDEEEEEERNRLLADTLSRSAYAEDQLAAAIIGSFIGVDRRIDNLTMALAADPTHPLVLWQVAGDCRRGRGGEYCADPFVRANVESVLGSNGWYWTQVAAFYYEEGLFDESLEALQRAVSAPEFDDYYIDHVLMLERALSADSDRDYGDRVVGAFGYTAAMPTDFFTRQCTLRGAADVAWLDSCTMLAERYEQDGTNLMMQLIGLTMQEDLYASAGLTAEVRDAQLRRTELEAWLDKVDADYELVQAVDPQLLERYLDVWATSGEVAAFEFTVSAVDELLEDPDYDPCVYLPSE
ncbi:MAG: hypothetical protein QNI99_05890 [Woeseiaceae bacterium]|nr:hypothetical protein [Woeseiaceae bacterium]